MPPPKAFFLLGMDTKTLKQKAANDIQPVENRKTHLGRGGIAVSLAPLTPDQALAAALRVKPADVKKLEEAEKNAKRRKS